MAAVLAACGSKGSSTPQHCATSAECPTEARCISSACVANAPPVANVAAPSDPVTSNVLVSFDASGSHDPDADDAIASYAWTFRASPETPCAPPVVAGTLPLATVRFACAGRYEGDLTVTDRLGASAAKTFGIDVVPYSGPAMVTVGPDVSLEHVCTSSPPRCTPAGEVSLSAATPGLAAEGVAFRWTVDPPSNRPLDANRRVEFSPSDTVTSPSVSIETDGEAISGDWVFRVEARDAAGIIGTAATRVSVGNRAPLISKTITVPNHTFDGALLRTSGEIPYTLTDPDGDAITAQVVEWHHVGDGGGTFGGVRLTDPPRVTFDVSVPYTTPSDGGFLIGGAGLERSVAFAVTDVNGGTTTESWPIVVGNRPPRLEAAPAAPFTVDHTYDAVAHAYRASVPLSTWSDPDGDPLLQAAGDTGDPECALLTIGAGAGARVATASCALAFAGTQVLANFVGTHAVSQHVRDPWDSAPQTSTVTFTIGNRPPAIASSVMTIVAGSCVGSGWCDPEATQREYTANAVLARLGPRWTDPDGDPLSIVAGTALDVTPVQPLLCVPADCVLEVNVSRILGVCGSEFRAVFATASDGLASVSGSFQIERACELP